MKRALFAVLLLGLASPADAARVANPIAVFSGLDKITGLTTTFEAKIGEEKRFGGLYVKADACYTRDVTEEPKTTSFVEVEEIESDNTRKKIFSGWMFAESPGLSAFEHPIYDVWLTGCRDPDAPPPVIEQVPDTQPVPEGQDEEPED
jgi:hypothetical protein